MFFRFDRHTAQVHFLARRNDPPTFPLEPEWEGYLTLEISNTTPLPAKVYANEGIMQLLFHRTEATCEMSYAAKKGRYQDQRGLTLPCVSQ
jgi:dCTP deaminase